MYVGKLYSENNNYPENSSVLIIICEVTRFFLKGYFMPSLFTSGKNQKARPTGHKILYAESHLFPDLSYCVSYFTWK